MIAYLLMVALNLLLGGQPYALQLDHVSPRLLQMCRLDPNCIDLADIHQPEGTDLASCQQAGDCADY